MLKRLFDILLATAALTFGALPLLALCLLVRLRLGSPVFFRQERAGRDGRPFRILKFRTMTDARDAAGNLLPDKERLTPFGIFLRRTSLDELPEFWNVLCGDMSVVGPRPLPVRYLERETAEQAHRNTVKPGITGWTQINGRNSLTWEAKFESDLWYLDHQSFWLDIKIVVITALKIFRCQDISAAGEATMPEFTKKPE